MASEMYGDADYTAAVDIYSFALIVYEVLVGKLVFPPTAALPVLFKMVSQGDRPPLPESMNSTVQEIIRQGWSGRTADRGSFEDIFDALRRIRFKMTPAVDMHKVAEFVALVEPSAQLAPEQESSESAHNEAPPPPKPGPVEVSLAVRPPKQFPPSMKKGKAKNWRREVWFDVPDGIIAHLARKCRGNVHDRHVVEVACGSFEKETYGANPHSGAYNNDPNFAAKNAADLETVSYFESAFREKKQHIPHMRNNWVCYDFKEKRIMPTHYTIRTNGYDGPGQWRLKSWLVEASVHGESWREVDHRENNEQLNGAYFAGTFAVAGGGECRFIRLVDIGRNHVGNDCLLISAREIFRSLID
jgi:hypothetical protein